MTHTLAQFVSHPQGRADHRGSTKKAPIPQIRYVLTRIIWTRPNLWMWPYGHACSSLFRLLSQVLTRRLPGGTPDAQGKCLRVQDVLILDREYGLSVTAPSFKMRQFVLAPTSSMCAYVVGLGGASNVIPLRGRGLFQANRVNSFRSSQPVGIG